MTIIALALPADLALHLRGEVLHHDPHLLGDRVRVQLHERLEQVLGLLLVVARVVLDLLQQPPVGLVGGVVREHVEDEPLLDRLAHAVEVERLELPVGRFRAEQLQRLGLGRGGEREEARVAGPPAPISARIVVPPAPPRRRRASLLGLRLLQGCRLRAPPLRLFVLSPDCEECASSTITAKRLPGSSPISLAITGNFWSVVTMIVLPDSSASLSWREVGVDVLDHAERLLELAHGGLELAVEDAPVGDDHDRVEHAPVGRVVQRRELVREPGDGEALAAAGRVLDQVALPGALAARVVTSLRTASSCW